MNPYPPLPRWAKQELTRIHKTMQRQNPKYPDGSTVIYQGKQLVVIDSYYKSAEEYGADNAGWCYNLNSPYDRQARESELTPINP